MDRSFEGGFFMEMSTADKTVKEDFEEDDPFDLKSLIHSTSKHCMLTSGSVVGEAPKTDTLIQIDDQDPWSVMDWERLRSEASALAAIAVEENTDWDAIQVEASAVAGSIKFSHHHLLSSSSPMSTLSFESPLSTMFSAGMSPNFLDSSPSSTALLQLSFGKASESLHSQMQPNKPRTPLTPTNHRVTARKQTQSEVKNKKSSYLLKKPSTLTFPPKKPQNAPPSVPSENPSRHPPPRRPTGSAAAPHKAQSRSISVPKKCPPKSTPPILDKPPLRRSISNMSQSQLQSFKSQEPSMDPGEPPAGTAFPYMKKSLTLPRKRPSSRQAASSALPKVNTTPVGPRVRAAAFDGNVVSSTPAQKGPACSVKFAQPALPSPIIKYSRFKK